MKRTAPEKPTYVVTPSQTKRALSLEDVMRHRKALTEHGQAAELIVRRMITGKRTLMREDIAPEAREEGGEAWREFVLALWGELRDAYYHYWFLRYGGSEEAATGDWENSMPSDSLLDQLAIHELFNQFPDKLSPPHEITPGEASLLVKWGWAPKPFPMWQRNEDLLSKLDQRVPW